jgi:superfamily II DNA or RNA helicase
MLDYNSIGLYAHQVKAVQSAKLYFDKKKADFSHLLKLPTGSGKSGIISVITRIVYTKKNFLIVVPSVSLKEQIGEDIENKFWEDIKLADKSNLNNIEVVKSLPGDIEDKLKKVKTRNYVLIVVTNSLHILKKSHAKVYEKLKNEIDFIFFDEGHKEPAFSWAKAVRDLEKPTILMSATPIRNDFRMFNIDKENAFFYSHNSAVRELTIRDVNFKNIVFKKDDMSSFSKAIKLQFDVLVKDYIKSGEKNVKMIIRCKSEIRIRSLVAYLNKEGIKAAGFFNSFKYRPSNHEYEHFSQLANKHDYKVYVHENKLIEGIDDKEILIVCILDEFTNDRAVIQQVGRILRNVAQKKCNSSTVLSLDIKPLKLIWNNYIAFDENQEKKLFDIKDIISINKDIEWIYWDKHFRKIQEFNSGPINYDGIKIPKRVSIRLCSSTFDFNNFIEEVEADIESEGFIINDVKEYISGKIVVIPYYKINLSPFYPDQTLFDSKYGVFIGYILNGHVYSLNTEGFLPKYIYGHSEIITKEKALKLLASSSRITKVNLSNSDLGKHALRSKNLAGFSLNDIPSSLADHMYVFNTVEGFVKDASGVDSYKRYLGLSRGKVSDYNTELIELKEYINWINQLDHSMNINSQPNDYFQRYALSIPPPTDTSPTTILIDISNDELLPFKNSENGENIIGINELAIEVAGNVFKLNINFKSEIIEYELSIYYDIKKKKYILSSKNGIIESSLYFEKENNNLINYLNNNQSFRITTSNNQAFYAYGEFYTPKLNLNTRRSGLDILALFQPIEDLKDIISEKGDSKKLKPSVTLWHPETLFGIIARLGKGPYKDKKKLQEALNFDYLVCDDLVKENADFIGLNKKDKTLTLIHAKGRKGVLSASSFQEVCGQTIKNLDLISPFIEKEPELSIKSWDLPWNDGKIGIVKKRIFKGSKTGKEFWGNYQEMVRDPATKKQVFIFTGGMFSKDKLIKELNKKDIKEVSPEVVQLIYLVRSTWASVSSMGAELKIFCYK